RPAGSRPTPGEPPLPAPGPATSDPDVPRDRPPGPHGCSRSTERSPAPGRSARLRGSRDAPRRTRSWLEAAVELRLGKIRRCLAQDLVGLPQLAYLALERLHPRPLVRRQAGRSPWSRSARRTQLRSVSAVHPIFPAIDSIAAHCELCVPWCSSTIRTARSRTSGEYFTGLVMTPSSQELEPPGIPGRFRGVQVRP